MTRLASPPFERYKKGFYHILHEEREGDFFIREMGEEGDARVGGGGREWGEGRGERRG